MLHLVIKGTNGDAWDACMLRGMVYSPKATSSHGEAIGEVMDGALSDVASWFAEFPPMGPGQGYPIGTLLWYRMPAWLSPEGS